MLQIQTKYSNVHNNAVLGDAQAIKAAVGKKLASRPQSDIVYMVDKDSSVTDLIRPTTNI